MLYIIPIRTNRKYWSWQRLEKRKNDVNSFNNHIKNIKEMIAYFKDENNKSKKSYRKYKTIITK